MRKLVAVLCFLVVLPAWAGIVISVDTADPDPFSLSGISVDANDVLAVAWSMPQTSYNAVSIGISFQELFSGGTYLAYLMRGIGPQADQFFDEIASTTFTVDPASPRVTLWTDLNDLGPGLSFYLVIGTTDPESVGGWNATSSPIVTLAPGVTRGDVSGNQFWASGADVNPDYLPASDFHPDSPDDPFNPFGPSQLMYDVSTPEPATWLLVMVGGIPLALLRRRALRRRG